MDEEKTNTSTRLGKKKTGYGYKYTELAQINEMLEERGESYYQYTETYNFNGTDREYIMTVKIDKDGHESKPIRGCCIVGGNTLNGGKMNEAQQLGSAITYARRYSLLMAYGLATEDDDALALTKAPQRQQRPAQQRQTAPAQPAEPVERIKPDEVKYIKDIIEKYPNKNLIDQVKKKYRVNAIGELTAEQGKKCIALLNEYDSQNSVPVEEKEVEFN